MIAKLKIAMRALRDLCCVAGAAAIGSFYAVERSWLWLLPMSLLVAFAAACFYGIEQWRAARRDRDIAVLRASHERAKAALGELAVHAPGRLRRRQDPPAIEDVASALRNLGYSRADAYRAARQAARQGDETNFEALFQAAQSKLARPDHSILIS